ncbi:MAG: ABC transporter permease [SAR86 cluster bacterium]|jgi:ABC-2 type transport system permease protein|nr:ABC transporter permease [SAR86 cluster bacterium]
MSTTEILNAFLTIIRKEVIRFTRIWLQTLVSPAIMIALYFVTIGVIIGSRIGEMGGFSFLQWMVPGMIMMSVINNAYSNVLSSFFNVKFQKSIEELLVTPVPNYIILGGWIFGGMARGIMVSVLVIIVSLPFVTLDVQNWPLAILVIFLTSMLFSIGGFINALFAESFDDVSIVPTFILTPLSYLGGIFYSINLLPEFWRTVSLGNPILYMVNALREAVLGSSDLASMNMTIHFALLMIVFFIIILFFLALWLLNRGKGIRT